LETAQIAPVLNGLGIELEWRSIFFNIPSEIPGHRMDTGLGGPYYQWRKYERIRPYGKYMFGFGSLDFPNGTNYTHDTRTIYAPGAGVDILIWRGVQARVDYEYQFWPNLFGPNSLTPNGFSFGAEYDFGRQLR
jgi:hypothetical protein